MNIKFKLLISFALGALIFSCISVYATTTYMASQIYYKDTAYSFFFLFNNCYVII